MNSAPRPPLALPTTRETAQEWTKDGSTLRFWYPTDHVVCHAFAGRLEVYFARIIIEKANLRMTRGKIYAFSDWGEMQSYASESRVLLTRWAFSKHSQIHYSKMLVHSRIVFMGVSVAGVALNGMIEPFTNRGAYERALEREIENAKQSIWRVG